MPREEKVRVPWMNFTGENPGEDLRHQVSCLAERLGLTLNDHVYSLHELLPVIRMVITFHRILYRINSDAEFMMIGALMSENMAETLLGKSPRPWRITAIASFFDIPRQSVRRTLDRMTELGWVKTERSGRTVLVMPAPVIAELFGERNLMQFYAQLVEEASVQMRNARKPKGEKGTV